ncbi:LLM class flavin-dependent oxidoreductase [Chitinophaga sp. S165]|uniref:LLM class flavin-dependent oxidoreductase n=1 Tax=Chitinophaga sp. S165 TaxID=2135462 RepID=UPI000D713462|nr:LLM class flavin-dependent oxidoreductase [Chitinophaga sp. S165]PWV56630.1 luciferase family oxidoreductase group 1 [Chitinophaga sp. S165]
MADRKLKISVLDQTPIRKGSNAVEALEESIKLAQLADRLGFTRYWVSEHHNSRTLAGAAPEVLISRLAAVTKHIRLGSGGVMLPNHSTLKVAENFRLLEALNPGRIDLGIGRAPGGDRLTSHILNPSNNFEPRDFVQQVHDLEGYLTDSSETGTVHEKVKAIPRIDTVPELWMLTSSGESGLLAARQGWALSFAHFIYPIGGPQAVRTYREKFKPSQFLKEPAASVGIFLFCADTQEKADELQAVMDYRLLSFEKGRYDETPSWEEVRDYEYSDQEWQRVMANRGRIVAGTPEQVKQRLLKMADDYGVDEIVAATITEKIEDRFRSYELLAEIFQLEPRN